MVCCMYICLTNPSLMLTNQCYGKLADEVMLLRVITLP
jgi:hypothetical protein